LQVTTNKQKQHKNFGFGADKANYLERQKLAGRGVQEVVPIQPYPFQGEAPLGRVPV